MLSRILTSLYHTLWYVTAGLILLVAVGVTLARLSLPYIDNYRAEVQQWLGDYLGQPVEIERIAADWRGWTPTLYLQDITVLNKSGIGKVTEFRSADITFDPITSLEERQLIPARLQINNPELTVIKQADGSITIAQESENAPFSTTLQPTTEFSRWLLQQRQIAIRDANLTLVNLTEEDYVIELDHVALSFKNIAGRTQISGSAELPEAFGDRVNFALDIQGDITTPSWSGGLYLEGAAIYPAELLHYIGWRTDTMTLDSSPVTVRLWSDWENASAYQTVGDFSAETLHIETTDIEQTMYDVKATFAAARNERNDFSLAIQTNDFLTSSGVSPTNRIKLQRKKIDDSEQSRYTVSFNHLNLGDVSLFQRIMPGIVEQGIMPDIPDMQGSLYNTTIIYDPTRREGQQFYIDSDFSNLSVPMENNTATISGLQGHIRGDADEGRLTLDATSLSLKLPDVFHDVLNFYEIQGVIDWDYRDGEWSFQSSRLSAHTLHFDSVLKGELNLPEDNSGYYADLQLAVNRASIEEINHYLPVTLDEELTQWLRTALVSGNLNSLELLLRGELDTFPYRNADGRLQVLASVSDVTLDYDSEWTPVDNLDAELQINQDWLRVDANAGKILSAQINDAVATIEKLGIDNPLLHVNGDINGTVKDAMIFINNSPLADTHTFREINKQQLQGGLGLHLDLAIPLYKDKTRVDGDLQLFNVALNTDPATGGLTLDNINGSVLFTRDSVRSENLQAHYAGKDVRLELEGDVNKPLQMRLNGSTDSRFLVSQISAFFPRLEPMKEAIRSRLSGSTDWQATITAAEAAGDNKTLTITSSLTGLAIDLPEPLGKTDAPTPFKLTTAMTGRNAARTVRFDYGDTLAGVMELDAVVPSQLNRATFSFGKPAELAGQTGIVIDGTVSQLSLSDWFNFINLSGNSQGPSLLDEIRFDIVARTLMFFDHTFYDVNIGLLREQANWQISLDGANIDGEINVPQAGNGRPLRATFDTFYIAEHDKTSGTTSIKPANIPPLQVRVKDFRYEDANMGELMLTTSTLPAGMSIDEMTFTKPDMSISGQGQWQLTNDRESSQFTFDVNADYLDAMLQTFNYSVAPIKEGATTLRFDANWEGSPADFSLARMDGSLTMNIEQGQLLNVEPAAGRLFGLLSLQTLPRRLSLDFSDLFGEGMTFDRIEGSFTIENGNAYTNNLTMTGPSANIGITGRTGLVAQDYDQLVTVTPQFADSLPVASALFGPIGVGVGAVLFLAGEMFESLPKQIDKLWRYQYTIKGSWDDPVVEKYRENPKSSG